MEEKTIDRIIKYLKVNEKGTVAKMVINFGVSKQVIHRKLNDLLAKKIIVKEGSAPKVTYSINKEKDKTISIAKVKKAVYPVLKIHGIKQAEIFGSLARGEQNRASDVDILVRLGRPMGFEFVGMKRELEEKVGRSVDLVSYDGIHPLFKKDILKNRVKIYDQGL
jgi:predicted nucleotidyltransferase